MERKNAINLKLYTHTKKFPQKESGANLYFRELMAN
jgi:hypothetical protein